jgi:hypothetical protein
MTRGLGSHAVQQVEEFRKHAEECRVMASRMRNAVQREQFLALAKQWDDLAGEREKLLRAQATLSEI